MIVINGKDCGPVVRYKLTILICEMKEQAVGL